MQMLTNQVLESKCTVSIREATFKDVDIQNQKSLGQETLTRSHGSNYSPVPESSKSLLIMTQPGLEVPA